VDEYIHLPNEVVEDEEEDVFESIVDRYSVDTEYIFEELEEGDTVLRKRRSLLMMLLRHSKH
jgi:hypothetical protein